MKMRFFIPLGLVCSLFAFLGANKLHFQRNVTSVALASPALAGCGVWPCESCSYPCLDTGKDFGTYAPNIQPCGDPETCSNGRAIDVIPGFYSNNDNGKDSIEVIQVPCKSDYGSGSTCEGGEQLSYKINKGACTCPSNQTVGYCTCEETASGTKKCVYKEGCGTDAGTCTSPDQECGCNEGYKKPHLECQNGTCTEVNSCGIDRCSTDPPPPCNAGDYWSCTLGCCVTASTGECSLEGSPILIDVLGNGFALTSAPAGDTASVHPPRS